MTSHALAEVFARAAKWPVEILGIHHTARDI